MNKIIYDFRRYGSNGELFIDYESLINFLNFVNNENLSTVKKHTPDGEKRDSFKKFVLRVDELLNSQSAILEEIHLEPSEQLNNDEMTSPIKLTEMAVQNIEAKYINSKYFVSELIKIEDDKLSMSMSILITKTLRKNFLNVPTVVVGRIGKGIMKTGFNI